MRKIPDTYTAICGNFLPHMRHYTEIRISLHTVVV